MNRRRRNTGCTADTFLGIDAIKLVRHNTRPAYGIFVVLLRWPFQQIMKQICIKELMDYVFDLVSIPHAISRNNMLCFWLKYSHISHHSHHKGWKLIDNQYIEHGPLARNVSAHGR
eukprot:652298_1